MAKNQLVSSIKLSPQLVEFRLQGLSDLNNRLCSLLDRSSKIGEYRPNLEAAQKAIEEEIMELALFLE